MGILDRLFGRSQGKEGIDAAKEVKKEIEDNLELLHFLATCGPFNLENLQTYFTLCSLHGKEFDSKAVIQWENADQTLGGFESLRSQILVPEHLAAWRTFFELLSKMRPTSETAQYLKEAKRRFDQIQAQLGKGTL